MPLPVIYGPYDNGTPTELFSLNMAMVPGMSENSVPRIINKALAYWQAIVAANVADSWTLTKANAAVTWLTAEKARVASPPQNSLQVVYPV
jgi:hypothetical protein